MSSNYYYGWARLGTIIGDKQYQVLRIANLERFDVYIAKNGQHNYCLLVQVEQNYLAYLKMQDINVKSLKLDFTQVGNKYNFSIQLLNVSDIQIFDCFLHYVLTNVKDHMSELDFLRYLVSNVKKWQNFMSTASKGILAEYQIRGLIAELFKLKQWLIEYPHHHEYILHAWMGPDKLQHDFIFNNVSIEIKSIGSSDKNNVMISSEHQLISFSDELYLIVLKVIRINDLTSGSIDLNILIQNIKLILSENYHDVLDQKLFNAGYAFNDKYDEYCYMVSQFSTYQICDEFPKITTSNLSIGISHVHYEIDLSVIEKFKIIKPIKIF